MKKIHIFGECRGLTPLENLQFSVYKTFFLNILERIVSHRHHQQTLFYCILKSKTKKKGFLGVKIMVNSFGKSPI